MKKTTTQLALIAWTACSTYAATTYDFTGKGDLFDGHTSVPILLTDGDNSTTMTVTGTGGNLNSNSGDFGIDGSEGGEVNDFIDGTTESVTLSFDQEIEFISIEFGSVGADLSDGVNLTIGGTILDLFTDVTDFDGTSDAYTPATAIALTKGSSIIITGSAGTSSFDLENIQIGVVPEPATDALLAGITGLAMVLLSRRNK